MALQVKDLSLRVGEFTLGVESLSVEAGTVVCLMGRSGSGKSTLLNAIAGFVKLDHGEIKVGGRSVEGLPPEKRKVAYLAQRAALFPHLTVFQNIEFPLRVAGVSKNQRDYEVEKWLNRMKITALSQRFPAAVSGGEAQRVAVARAMITGFPVLLMDEPFTSLDPALRIDLRTEVEMLAKENGAAILLVTHDVEDAQGFKGQCILFSKGRSVFTGSSEQVIQHLLSGSNTVLK